MRKGHQSKEKTRRSVWVGRAGGCEIKTHVLNVLFRRVHIYSIKKIKTYNNGTAAHSGRRRDRRCVTLRYIDNYIKVKKSVQ